MLFRSGVERFCSVYPDLIRRGLSMMDCVIGWGVGDIDMEHHIRHYCNGAFGDNTDARVLVYSTSRGMVRLQEALHNSLVFAARG